MKQTAIFFLLFISITNVKAQFWTKKLSGNREVATETRTVGNYDKLSITGAFKVKIVPGSAGSLQVTADENLLGYIETYIKGGKLVIRVNPEYSISHYTKLYVEVPANYLSQINLTGSGEVFNTENFDWKNIKLNLTGSGNFDIKTNVTHLKANLVGSGEIFLTGQAETANYLLTGSGVLSAKELKAQNVKASLTGSGEMRLRAVQNLDARVMGSGNILYYGEPDVLKTNNIGGGDIILKRM